MQLTEEDLLKAGNLPHSYFPESKDTISDELMRRIDTTLETKPAIQPLHIIEKIQKEPYEIIEPGSMNNGGKTDYYQLDKAPFPIRDFDDFAEWRKLNGFQFNIGKVVWTFNVGRHSGTDYERELNKIIHYAKRELKRVRREVSNNTHS